VAKVTQMGFLVSFCKTYCSSFLMIGIMLFW